jgi:hypothetical protein
MTHPPDETTAHDSRADLARQRAEHRAQQDADRAYLDLMRAQIDVVRSQIASEWARTDPELKASLPAEFRAEADHILADQRDATNASSARTELDATGREQIREQILTGELSPAEAAALVPEWERLIPLAATDPTVRIAAYHDRDATSVADTADVDEA